MAKTRIRLEGLEHTLQQFRRVPAVARKHLGDAIRQTEIALVQKMQHAAPVRTGALRQAIGSKTIGLRGQISIEGAPYWRFVEFGTRYAAAQPFIRPAAESEHALMVERVTNAALRMEKELSI